MIASLHGTLAEKNPTSAIIEVAGIGYEAAIPLSTYDRLPATGAACRLLVHHLVREDDELLFGFAAREELDSFRLLLSVSGVGPRLALSVLSGLTVSELRASVAEGNVKRLSSVRGVGRKTAERIVVELKDKVDPAEALAAPAAAGGTPAGLAVLRDAVLALTALGFAQDQARKMIQAALDAGAPATQTEDLVRRALAGR